MKSVANRNFSFRRPGSAVPPAMSFLRKTYPSTGFSFLVCELRVSLDVWMFPAVLVSCCPPARMSVTLPPSGAQLLLQADHKPSLALVSRLTYHFLCLALKPPRGLLPLAGGLQRAAALNSSCLRTACLAHSFPLVFLLTILLVWSQVCCL